MTAPNTFGVERTLNQFVVQWDVVGALNGNTDEPAPSLATSGGVLVPNQQDEDGVFRIPTPGNIGIIDPDALGAQGGSGDRYIQWIRVESGAGNIPPGFAIRIVDASNLVPSLGDPIVFEDITAGDTFGVAPSFYRSQFIFVPQGCAIQVLGLPGFGAGNENRVKIAFRSATSAREDAGLQKNMCCQSGAETDGGGGTPEDEDVALQSFDFSALALSMVSTDFGNYVTWSGSLDFGTVTDTSDAIIAFASDEDLAAFPGVAKLTIRAGSLTGMVIRTTTPLIIDAFIEISVGAAAFVRTVIATGEAIAANANVVVPITPTAFATDTRIRVGYTIVGNVVADVMVALEITTPI